jgi:hypothetical protein
MRDSRDAGRDSIQTMVALDPARECAECAQCGHVEGVGERVREWGRVATNSDGAGEE